MTVNLKRCDAGHHYDPTQHTSCPFCGVPSLNISATRPVKKKGAADEEVTMGAGASPRGKLEARGAEQAITVGYYHKKIGIDPVVGWLVCIEGPDQGRDYRLHSERNFIGRSDRMDVCVRGDDTISRENHAIIAFNPRTSGFKLQPGDGRGLIYLNGEEVDASINLNPFDLIELGQTKLLFIPFCGEKFQWEAKDQPAE